MVWDCQAAVAWLRCQMAFPFFTWWRPFLDNASPATALSNEAFLQLKKIDKMKPNILNEKGSVPPFQLLAPLF